MFAGADVVFSPSLVGSSPLFYQWRKNGTNLLNSGNVFGSGTRSLTLSNVSAPNAGTYSLFVSNFAGSIVSSNAILQVTSSAPVIVAQPTNQTMAPGGTATFTVSGYGDFPLIYQWRKDGTNLIDSGNIVGAPPAT